MLSNIMAKKRKLKSHLRDHPPPLGESLNKFRNKVFPKFLIYHKIQIKKYNKLFKNSHNNNLFRLPHKFFKMMIY